MLTLLEVFCRKDRGCLQASPFRLLPVSHPYNTDLTVERSWESAFSVNLVLEGLTSKVVCLQLIDEDDTNDRSLMDPDSLAEFPTPPASSASPSILSSSLAGGRDVCVCVVCWANWMEGRYESV